MLDVEIIKLAELIENSEVEQTLNIGEANLIKLYSLEGGQEQLCQVQPDAEVVLSVLRGTGSILLDVYKDHDQVIDLEPEMVISLPENLKFCLKSSGKEKLVILATFCQVD